MTDVQRLEHRQEIQIADWCPTEVQEYTDGSRLEGAAAAASTTKAEYLGTHATVMDAELLGPWGMSRPGIQPHQGHSRQPGSDGKGSSTIHRISEIMDRVEATEGLPNKEHGDMG